MGTREKSDGREIREKERREQDKKSSRRECSRKNEISRKKQAKKGKKITRSAGRGSNTYNNKGERYQIIRK